MTNTERRDIIISKNNLTLCGADYFQAYWCLLGSLETFQSSYLLRHVASLSNSTYFCVYHIIRKSIECFDFSHAIPRSSVSNLYLYLTVCIFIIGFIGNGISIIILLCAKLGRLSIYRNLTILCLFNILYLLLVLIRHWNIYQEDLRDVSVELCRLHKFMITFVGHLCSWQLVSTSIQRVHALLSLQSQRTTSWIQTWSFLLCMIIPLFLFDAQILFNFGLFQKSSICNEFNQFRRARNHPINVLKLSNHTPVQYHIDWFPTESPKFDRKELCVLWSLFDTFIYAIIPFIITLACSFIIIIKVCQRRRSTVILGGICHINREVLSTQDHLSTLLITINILFLIMTGPLNFYLIVESIFECLLRRPLKGRQFLVLQESLRLLQNSYHALSFIFYCVIGNKFRNSAKSICRTVYCKLLEFGIADRCAATPFVACCLDRRRSTSSGQTLSTNSRLSETRRLTADQRLSSLIPLNTIKRPTYVTIDINQKTIIRSPNP